MHPSMSSQTLQREIEMVRANRYEITDDLQGSASVPRVHRQNGNAGKSQHLSQQEQFLRSASARLPKKEEDPNRIDGEKKREESMKRLLEWKQRMLQSPLTRKGPQLSVASPGGSQTNTLHLPSKSPLTVQGGSYYQLEQQKSNHALQRSRSESQAGSAYAGESSEDEGESNLPKFPSVMALSVVLAMFFFLLTVKHEFPIELKRIILAELGINYVALGTLIAIFMLPPPFKMNIFCSITRFLSLFFPPSLDLTCVILYSLPVCLRSSHFRLPCKLFFPPFCTFIPPCILIRAR